MPQILPMPTAAERQAAALAESLATVREAVDHSATPAEAFALWRHICALEQQLETLADYAADRCEAFGVDANLDRPVRW